MKNREYGDYVEDISESVNAIEEFTKGMKFEDFTKDRKTIFAVVRCIEIIGEATKNIPKSIGGSLCWRTRKRHIQESIFASSQR